MTVTLARPAPMIDRYQPGTYLTDGQRLLFMLGQYRTTPNYQLEDCATMRCFVLGPAAVKALTVVRCAA